MEKFNVTINEGNRNVSSQNATFADQNPAFQYSVDSNPDPTYGVADMNDASLGSFFSRPIRVADYEWNTGNPLFENFNPWTLYFGNSRVVNRISNFNLLRAKLCIKVVVNGNGFHYGRAILSYLPLPGDDDTTLIRNGVPQDLVAASQRPHIYLDPTTSQGGEMCFPFFWKDNALNIPASEWRSMGECNLSSFGILKHANGATDRVTISIFAWAEDVSLSIPTSVNPSVLIPQGGFEDMAPHAGVDTSNQESNTNTVPNVPDEYGTGVISRPASMVAKIAGMLNSAPIIGPYAMATQLAANATARVASLFGYSRPAIISDIAYMKPTLVGNMANTNVPDSIQRLSLDVKQEVTIDPRTTGLGSVDEMAIVPLAMRESYLTSFTWNVADSVDDLLWNTYVTPMLYDRVTSTNPDELHMTPACWATMPFKFWRGSMKFRFQVVASQYHKGRLRIVWDPRLQESSEFNINYQYIIDIAENKDFTVTIGWGSSLPYLEHGLPGISTFPFSATPINFSDITESNGVLSVFIVNELTVPNSTVNNDIFLNVFPSMCSDYEVGNPDGSLIEPYSYFPQPAVAALAETHAVWPLGREDLLLRKNRILEEKMEKDKESRPSLDELVEQYDLDVNDFLPLAKNSDIVPQSGVETNAQADSENTKFPSAPVAMESNVVLGPPDLRQDDGLAAICLGEAVTSTRQLLKRYTFHTTFAQTLTDERFYQRTQWDLPYYRGFSPNGVNTAENSNTGLNAPYNRSKMTFLNWFSPAYVGWRGALRWKYNTVGNIANPAPLVNEYMEVNRDPTWDFGFDIVNQPWITAGTPNDVLDGNMSFKKQGGSGVTRTSASQNPNLEVELPWYDRLRFEAAKKLEVEDPIPGGHFHTFSTVTKTANGVQWDAFCATGEDFSLYFFTGPPIVYFYGINDPSTV